MSELTASASEILSAPAAALAGPRRVVAIAAVLLAMTMAVLDAGMANLALPSLAHAFRVAPASTINVMIAYQAGLVMALLPLGAVGERFGPRRVFAASIAVFAAAATAAALAPDLQWLVGARLVQGFAGGGIMALGVALLRFTVPTERLGAAIGWNALAVALASAAAPSVGAVLLTAADWRSLFAVGLPVAGVALAAACALPVVPRRVAPLDLISVALSVCVFGFLVLAAQTATGAPAPAAGLLAAAVIALILLVHREGPKTAPLLPLDLLRQEPIRLSVIASVCCFTAQSAGLVALPFLLQIRLHQTPMATALYMTAWPLSVAVTATISGHLGDRFPTGWLCAAGSAGLAAGLVGFVAWPVQASPAVLIPFIVLAGLGFGLFQSPNNRNMFLSAPAGRSGAAGGMQGTARVSGQTFGALLMALLFSRLPLDTALLLGFAVAAGMALAAGVVSLMRTLC